MTLKHPARNELLAYGQGQLAVDEAATVERHLERCRDCCQTLLNLEDDTFVGLLRHSQEVATVGQTDQRQVVFEEESEGGRQAVPEATDGAIHDGDASHAATMLVTSDSSIEPSDLPAALVDHPRYQVLRRIGGGGMGDVYLAQHRLMNRQVALKLINSRLIQHPQAVERFRREVQAAAQLHHPNVVAAYDAEQAGDVHFLAMEFVDGIDLAEFVEQNGPLSVEEACDYVRQTALGLQHAHEKGMVHRDIKPHNLMLVSRESRGQSPELIADAEPQRSQRSALDSGRSFQDSLKILDFGLAGFATESACLEAESAAARGADIVPLHLTTIGSVMGTPDYIAPEQARDAHLADIRADIYSLGCTLYFLLTGRPPFATGSVVEKLEAHAQQAPQPLSELRDDVPPELSALVDRMLAKDPSDRFAEPREVAEELARFAISGPAAKEDSRFATQPRKQALPLTRKARLVRTLMAIVGIVLLCGVIEIATARGRIFIRSEVGNVKVVVRQNGEQVAVIDMATGSQATWAPTGDVELELVGTDNAVNLDQSQFEMTRLGQVIVTARWDTSRFDTFRSFATSDETISRDGVSIEDDGWKITASDSRAVRLFEVPLPAMQPGPFFYRAKLKSENVTGRAYLEMWVRFPGHGEYFSKGLFNAVSGTNGWAEYEIPFLLEVSKETGQIDPAPDQVKLNLVIEGSGTVWIKEIELRGHAIAAVGPADESKAPAQIVADSPNEVLRTAEPIRVIPHGESISSLAWLADRSIAWSSWDEMAKDWKLSFTDAAAEKLENRVSAGLGGISQIVTDPQGKWLAVALRTSEKVQLWDATQRKLLHTFEIGGLVHSVSLSPDGTLLVAASWNGSAKIWNTDSHELVKELGGYGRVHRVAFSPDGKMLAVSETPTGQTDLWETESWTRRSHCRHGYGVGQMAFTPDSRLLITGGTGLRNSEPEKNSIKVWNAATGKLEMRFDEMQNAVEAVVVSPDSRYLVAVGGNWGDDPAWGGKPHEAEPIRIWDLTMRRLVAEFHGHDKWVRGLAFSPDGRQFATAANEIKVWDWDAIVRAEIPAAEPRSDLTEAGRFSGHEGWVYQAIVSPDGRFGISGGEDKAIRIWDLETQQEQRVLNGHDGSVFGLAISADGKLLASSDKSKSIRLWNFETGEQIAELTGHEDAVSELAFLPDGRLLAAGFDETLRIWDVVEHKLLRTIDLGAKVEKMEPLWDDRRVMLSGAHTGGWGVLEYDLSEGKRIDPQASAQSCLAVSADQRLALVGSITGLLRVTDMESGELLVQLADPRARAAMDAAMTSDGRFALTTTREHQMHLWDLNQARLLSSAEGPTIGSVVLSPDSRFAVTIRDEGSVGVWRLPEIVWRQKQSSSAISR